MQVEVIAVEPRPAETVWIADGIDVEDGSLVTFSVDWRPARDVAEMINAGVNVRAEIADWQVIHRA
jgi:hypothetical protein